MLGPLVVEADICTSTRSHLRLQQAFLDCVERLCPKLRKLYVSSLNDKSIGTEEAVAKFGGRLRQLRTISSAHWGAPGLEILLHLSDLQHPDIYRAQFSTEVAGSDELLRKPTFRLQSLRLCQPSSPAI